MDTSYLIALVSSTDAHHERAVAAQGARHAPLITTEFVLLELADALCTPATRPVAVAMIDLLRSDRHIAIVEASPASLDAGLSLYRERDDKAWSLTDCISIQVMRSTGCSTALTADRHFEQAGFKALLREDPA